MLGPYLFEALRARSATVADEALAAYDRARRWEFASKWRVQKLVAFATAWPPFMNRCVRAASGSRVMADALVNVASGFAPASDLLRPSILRALLQPAH